MAKRIKLENIIPVLQSHKHNDIEYGKREYCPICGESLAKQTIREEYVCEACRHLVQATDIYCSHCSERLSDTDRVDHYIGGLRINDKLFQLIKNEIEI